MDKANVFLFGSGARGDPDEASDIDVVAIYSAEPDANSRSEMYIKLVRHFGNPVALAEYSRARIAEMFQQGHLFAWHLFLEAKRLSFEGLHPELDYNFPVPAPYTSGIEDALRFSELLHSIYKEVNNEDACSEVHEAGLTYLSLRNIAMSLSYSCCMRPDFTRYSPYNLSDALGISPPVGRPIYDALIKARHSSQRGLLAPTISRENLTATLNQCLDWAELVREKVNERY
jgi:predicted nucleotidyltransferase